MASYKKEKVAAKKPIDPNYLGLFRILMTDDPRLSLETEEEKKERVQSDYGKLIDLLYHGTVVYRRTYQFIPVSGGRINFAPMTEREFGEFCLIKSAQYVFERGKDSYEFIKVYRRVRKEGENQDDER